jgi:hypothetical protein
VLADGTIQTFHRPLPGQAPNDLYWAVLGGGPGSFGVVTEIKLECIRDSDHPKSFGYERALFFENKVFRDAMMQVKYWTENINNPDFPKDVDLMVSASSMSFNPARPFGGILLELVYGNYDGAMATPSQVNAALQVIDDTINTATRRRSAFAPSYVFFDTRRASPSDRKRALSYMSKAFVREPGIKTTYGAHPGREFTFPYKKRLQCTTKPLTQQFVNDFSNLVRDVIHGPDKENIKLVFQMTLGGGQVKNPGEKGSRRVNTSISGRDHVIGIVLAKANRFQERMQMLVDEEFGEDLRMQWGSFGNVDMKEVWQHYYDSKELYEKLQDIKKATDPNDVFHTKFTVPLPDDDDVSEALDAPPVKKRKTS